MTSLLSDVTVLEASSGVAVRYCGRLFAVLGARVLYFEPRGDREIGFCDRAGEVYGQWLDQGKTQVAVEPTDLKATLVIGGQDGPDLAKAEALAQASGAILLALTWFDPQGPYANWRGTDEVIAALTGMAFSFGERHGPPMLPQGHAPQLTAGVIAFIAAMAALLTQRERRAARIDVNILEATMCYSEVATLNARNSGEPSVRLGVNRYVPTYPCSAYRAADGWVGITCLTPAQWAAMCQLIGRPELATDPQYDTAYKRLMKGEEIDALLAPAIAQKTQSEWIQLAIAHRIPIAPMVSPGRLPEVPHWHERNAFDAFSEAAVRGPTLPFRMSPDQVLGARWSAPDMEHPLAGLRVIDFGMGWAGPLCSRTLADLGADVVKIESETHPDWWRGWEAGSVAAGTRERQANFINVNRNKRGIDVDLTQPEGIRTVKALLAGADVVIENYAAGVMTKLGIGQEMQRQLRPGVISVSMPAFGNGGPLSGIRAYGSTVEQASGLPFINGEHAWVPAQQHIALGDPISGLYAASGVLAALYARHRHGGACIDMAQVACLFQIGADAIIAEQITGEPIVRSGHARKRLKLCAVVRAAEEDRWLCVAVPDEATLNTLAAIVGGPDRDSVSVWAQTRSVDAAAAELQRAGIPAAPANPPHVLMEDAQLKWSGYFAPMQRKYVGEHYVGASPFRFDGRRPPLRHPAPTLGEHTADVLSALDAQYAAAAVRENAR